VNGYDLIAHCLKAEGVTWMPCFPANPLIEAAAKVGIRPLVFRQERGGINAADGYARQTRGAPPGVFASQSGPGVENSFGGIAQAWGEAVPLVFLPGGAGLGGYDVSPNFSATKNYASVTKLALSIDRIDRTATQIRRAFHTARQGRPGPVVVEMHGDVLGQPAPEGAAEQYKPSTAMRSVPGAVQLIGGATIALGEPLPESLETMPRRSGALTVIGRTQGLFGTTDSIAVGINPDLGRVGRIQLIYLDPDMSSVVEARISEAHGPPARNEWALLEWRNRVARVWLNRGSTRFRVNLRDHRYWY